MKNKNLEKLLKGSEDCFLIATKNGAGIVGSKMEVLTLFHLLVKKLRESVDDELLKKTFELGFKSEDEVMKMVLEKLETLLKKNVKEE